MSKRCLVEFTEAGYEAVQKLRRELDAKETEVLASAIRVYEDLFKNHQEGYRMLLIKGRSVRELKVPLFIRKSPEPGGRRE